MFSRAEDQDPEPRFKQCGNRHAGLLAALGSRRAATDRCGYQHDRWRIVADRRRALTVTPALARGVPMILPGLYPSDVQPGSGSLDLTRKRTEVQLLPRPLSPLLPALLVIPGPALTTAAEGAHADRRRGHALASSLSMLRAFAANTRLPFWSYSLSAWPMACAASWSRSA